MDRLVQDHDLVGPNLVNEIRLLKKVTTVYTRTAHDTKHLTGNNCGFLILIHILIL